MIKLFIVDDEKVIRDGLKHFIDWNQYGFEIVGSADKGSRALERIRELSPQAVITDIRMPDMSGLELIEHVKKFNSDIKFIILSGYDEFQYAKKAIDLNVKGYLLKPIEEEELIPILHLIREELTELSLSKKQQLYHYLHQLSTNNEAIDEKYKERTDLNGQYYYFSIRLDEDDTLLNAAKNTSRDNEAMVRLFEGLSDFIGAQYQHCILKEGMKGHGMAVSWELIQKRGVSIRHFSLNLHSALKKYVTMPTSVLVGKRVKGLSEISQSKASIGLCEHQHFYQGTDSVIIYEEIENCEFSTSLKPLEGMDQLIQKITKGIIQGIEEEVTHFCSILKEEKISPDTVKLYLNNIVMEIIRQVDEMHGDITRLTARYSLFNRMNGVTVNSLQLFLMDVCKEAAEEMTQSFKKKNLGLIGEIIDYIKENYREDLDLQILAKIYFVNANYLGRLFRKKTGTTLSAYLNQIRIEEAKKLMHKGEQKIYLIAEKVGFKDANYFCIKFEEYEHVSPSSYKEQISNSRVEQERQM